MSGEDLRRGEDGRSTFSVAPWTDVLNPLATFRADAFVELRRREQADNHRQLVLRQARAIHGVLMRADVHAGLASILSSADLFPENAKHLTDNGFRVWEIADVHAGRLPLVIRSYHVTWDSAADFTFRPHFEKHLAYHREHGNHIKDSSFNEIVAAAAL